MDEKEKEIKEKEIIADLHIHSRFSRACSSAINIENLVKWAKVKGLNLLGTGDFTHPKWLSEIREKLVEKNGIYYYNDFAFMLTSEISLVYTQNEKGRRVHLVYLAPSLEVVDKINSYLDTKGRRDYDGRPIFKISCRDFVKDMKEIDDTIEIIPAHIWTPWFGIFGSMGGFDSLQEAFGDQVDKVYAIETGISSDPEMNSKIKELDNKSIISFSDSHSFWPWRLGREATIFLQKNELSYNSIIEQIRSKTYKTTIEADPAYGKYHYDGHRDCNFSCSPEKTKELNGICPVCHKSLTIGVDNRVKDVSKGYNKEYPYFGRPYYKILPLHEIISLALGTGMNSKGAWKIYNELIEKFENEFNILLKVPKGELERALKNQLLVDLIIDNRTGNIKVKPGYDGVYGVPILPEKQKKLF